MVFKYLSIEVQQTKKHFNLQKNGVQKEKLFQRFSAVTLLAISDLI